MAGGQLGPPVELAGRVLVCYLMGDLAGSAVTAFLRMVSTVCWTCAVAVSVMGLRLVRSVVPPTT